MTGAEVARRVAESKHALKREEKPREFLTYEYPNYEWWHDDPLGTEIEGPEYRRNKRE